MKKLLVTTDLSANSKAGIKFALQLSRQIGSRITIYHFLEFNQPTRWSDKKTRTYMADEVSAAEQQVSKFVSRIIESEGAHGKFEIVVDHGSSFQRSVIQYALANDVSAICISTHGAGKLKKLIGTNSSGILTTSPVPVFVIPSRYKISPLSTIFYASDLNDLPSELNVVKRLASSLKARVLVHHYDYLYEVAETKQKLAKVADRYKSSGAKFIFQKLNLEQPLAQQLTRDFSKTKASLAILFTNQKRSWFDRVFLSSKTADVSFTSKIPLLVFPKK